MNSFLYRGSKDFEQNVVTGVIQAPLPTLIKNLQINFARFFVIIVACPIETGSLPLVISL